MKRKRSRAPIFRELYDTGHRSLEGLVAIERPAPWQLAVALDLRGLIGLLLLIGIWAWVFHSALMALP